MYEESASIGALYRDCNSFKKPYNDTLISLLDRYVNYVIDTGWVLQQQGVIPKGGTAIINQFQAKLFAYEPTIIREANIHKEALEAFNLFVVLRRLRLSSTDQGLPYALWLTLLIGAFINIVASWMFVPETKTQGLVLNSLFSITIGVMIYSIIILDNSFRGHISVSS